MRISCIIVFSCIPLRISLLDSSMSRPSSSILVSLYLLYSDCFSSCFLSNFSLLSVLFTLSSIYSFSSICRLNYSFSSTAIPLFLKASFLCICFAFTSYCMTVFASKILTLNSSTYLLSIRISWICSLNLFLVVNVSSFDLRSSYCNYLQRTLLLSRLACI